ncbi:MAG: mucoidy inhibitor MuiA family protein [Pseudomonadota bacterium]
MNAMLWIALAVVGLPDVIAGPDLAATAVRIDAPIAEVTVYSDRARVRRVAQKVPLVDGTQTLQLPDLPGAVLLDTVRVGSEGAKVLRVEAAPVARERISIEQVDGLIEQLESLTDKLEQLGGQRQVYQAELGLLGGLAPRAPVPESERVGKPLPTVEPALWKKVLDFLQQRREKIRAEIRSLDEKRELLADELAKVQREVGRHNLGAFTDRRIQVLVMVEAKDGASPGKVTLEYFVPGAFWRPSYDLSYLSDSGSVKLQTAGVVSQATGEEWANVELHLSTAIPGQGFELPELLTWTLGEKKELVPEARAARMPSQPPRFSPPSASKTVYEGEREAKLQVLEQRIAHLGQLLATNGRASGESDRRRGPAPSSGFVGGTMGGAAPARSSAPSVAQTPPPAPPDDYQEEDAIADEDLDYESVTAEVMAAPEEQAPTMPASQSYAFGRASAMMAKPKSALRSAGLGAEKTSLSLFDGNHYRRPVFSDSNLPAVMAGGLDYVWECPTKMSIPSSGEAIAVPLTVETFPAIVLYEATPSLKETAYLKAEVENKGRRPILGGAVNIFMGSDFSGQGRLKTTGPGGKLPLPLGADEDIRLKRTVVPRTETKGVFSKDEVTSYQVTIEVGNYKRRPIRIAVVDQIPKSANEKITIGEGPMKPKPVKGPDVDGILRWELDIPAGQTAKIEFSYQIKRPENWQLSQ